MSGNSSSLAGADRPTATGNPLSALGRRLATRSRRLWRAYWDHRARRATVLMLEALDDRSLKDIGLSRSQIRHTVARALADSQQCDAVRERRWTTPPAKAEQGLP